MAFRNLLIKQRMFLVCVYQKTKKLESVSALKITLNLTLFCFFGLKNVSNCSLKKNTMFKMYLSEFTSTL